MKALIFNSGLGSRLGELTTDKPKCLIELSNGESILERQIRILFECGISDFVITLGPFPDRVRAATRRFELAGCKFVFVNNTIFAETNYLYSMHLAAPFLRCDECLVLHGDLVFDASFVQAILDTPYGSYGAVNTFVRPPVKDFKARIVDGLVREVSVDIFDDDCFAFQPFYKLSAESLGIWLDAVASFVEAGEVRVYAENAANAVFEKMHVAAFEYENYYVAEIDTPEDLISVSSSIRLRDFALQPVFLYEQGRICSTCKQSLVGALRNAGDLADVVLALGVHKPLIVAGHRFESSVAAKTLRDARISFSRFDGFSSNPIADEVISGYKTFILGGFDALISYGGGSAIDVAKCIKACASRNGFPFDGLVRFADIPHIAIATTAGTGSESTRFAVCYVDGAKTSITHDSLLPEVAVLDIDSLQSLPAYHRVSTYLDALCQAIESHWSKMSSINSRLHSARAMTMLAQVGIAYCKGDNSLNSKALYAANEAGKAINFTTTTAPHAMSYALTSKYGFAHGHAVALCMVPCWDMLLNRGDQNTLDRLHEIARYVTRRPDASPEDGLSWYRQLLAEIRFEPIDIPRCDIDELVLSVNAERLGNFVLPISKSELKGLYQSALQAI